MVALTVTRAVMIRIIKTYLIVYCIAFNMYWCARLQTFLNARNSHLSISQVGDFVL